MQGRGVGSMLRGILSRAVRERGITKFTGVVQADNERTKSFVHALSSEAEGHFAEGAIKYEVDVPPPFPGEHRDSVFHRLLKLAVRELSVVFGVGGGKGKKRKRAGGFAVRPLLKSTPPRTRPLSRPCPCGARACCLRRSSAAP